MTKNTMDKMDLCLLTIDVVKDYFQKAVNSWQKEQQFDIPRINLAISEMDADRYAELDTIDAFHEYTVTLNKLWMLEADLDQELLIGIVAHEAVHAFQLTREALEEFPSSGKSGEPYWFCDYEIEARGYERAFVWLVNKKLKKLKKKSS